MHWLDPEYLPLTRGTVERFTVNPDGALDGLVLSGDGGATLVHLPPHLSGVVRQKIRPGEKVSIRGVRLRGADLVAAVALTTADGSEIVDRGPETGDAHRVAKDDARAKRVKGMTAAGIVRLALHGPKGELRGALLEDGVLLRVERKAAAAAADLLRPGAALAVRGDAVETPEGIVIDAREIGPTPEALRPIAKPKPRKSEEAGEMRDKKRPTHERGGDDHELGEAVPPAICNQV